MSRRTLTPGDLAGIADFFPQVVDSTEVFDGKVINVRVDTIEVEDGRRITRETVEYPGAVVVIALDGGGEVTMVRQYRHSIGHYLLELPAGGLEPGEEPLLSAQRELREEAGLEAGRWTALGSFYSSPGFANEILHVFLAEDLRPGYADTDEDEDLQVIRYRLSDLYAHPEQLQDAKSLAALMLLQKTRDAAPAQ